MSFRGPKNPDDYRVDYYRSRHYFDTLPTCELRPEGPMPVDKKGNVVKKGNVLPAQSTIMKAIPADALLYWAVGKTAEYAVDERDKWEKLDRDDAVDVLKKAHRKESSKAASRGSDAHGYIEARLYGRTFDLGWLNDDAKPYVPVIDRFFDDQTPELVLSEVVGIGHGHGVTTDAVLRLPKLGDGLDVADWKTRNDTVKEPHVVYEKEVAQLGANLDLRYWIVEDSETGTPSRLALPEGMGAVLVTFTTTSYAIHRVDPEQAVAGFRSVFEWSKALKRLRDAAEKPVVVELPAGETVAVVPEVVEKTPEAPSEPEPVETSEAATEPPILVDRDELRRRIEKISTDETHKAALVAVWPISVGLTDAPDDDLGAILRAVELTEAKFELPFDPPPPDPVPPRETVPAPVSDPTPDEGPDVGSDDVDTVRKTWALLEVDGAKWIETLAGGARNLSMTERPSARRARIGFSLVRLAVAGWGDNELLEVVLDHANALRHRGDVARSLAALDWHDAGRLSTTVGELVAERLKFSAVPSDGGSMRLEAA